MNTSLLVLLAIAAFLLVMIFLVSRLQKPRLNKTYFIKHWDKIEKESNPMAALVHADSLVDEALKRAGIKGDTMGERLNNSRGLLRDINGTWAAHKLRNRAVHEPGTTLNIPDTKRSLRQFKKALKDLGAL